MTSGDVYAVDDLWLSKESSHAVSRLATATPIEPGLRTEREIIEAALIATRGRVAGPSGAATKLGIPDSTLDSKIKALGISKNRFKP